MAVFKTLKSKITVTILGPLLAGLIIMISLSTVVVVNFAENSADDSADAMREEELEHLDRLAADKAALVDEYFKQIEREMYLFYSFTEDLFNGDINTTSVPSFNGVTAVDRTLPPGGLAYNETHERNENIDVSAWYLPGLSDLNDVNDETWDLVNLSSNLDLIYKSLYRANPSYSAIYMGFEDTGLFRIHPYYRLDRYLRDDIYTSAIDGSLMPHYDPRGRIWYQDAKTTNDLTFSAYMGASGQGLLVTASMPIRWNGSLLGVIAVDLTIKAVEESVLGLSVLDDGYAYVVDSEGNTIIHPDIDPTIDAQPIENLEFSTGNQHEITEFRQRYLASMKLGEVGSGAFTKNGEKWYLSYSPIKTTGYCMVIVATEEDIIGPSESMRSEIMDSLYAQLAVFMIIILIVGGLIVGFAFYTSNQVVKPVLELTEVTDLIASGNLNRDLTEEVGGSKEIQMLYTTFQGLITALRFGNDEYYAGNIDRAMKNYQAALDLFTTLDNQKGIGICHNNIGNIQKAKGSFTEAEAAYQQAIMIGNEILGSAPEEEKTGLIAGVSSRYNNLGLLYLDQNQFEKALQYLYKALELDNQINNSRGSATRYGNLGLLYLKMGKGAEAKQSFEKGYSIAQSSTSDRAKAYSTMNMGIWKRQTGFIQEAIGYFAQAVQQAQDLDIRVVQSSLQNLKEIYEENGDWRSLDQVQTQLDRFKTVTSKDVMFALDHSGSMRGRRISAALRGLLDILEKQINQTDNVSFLTFSEYVNEILELTMKEGNEEAIKQTIQSLEQPYGRTAFYDAVGYAYAKLEAQTSQNEQWLIALTDGDDNASRSHSSVSLQELAMANPDVNLVIIGVGEITDSQLLASICQATANGKFIDMRQGASVAGAIEAAFEEVGSMLMEVEVEGFVSDY